MAYITKQVRTKQRKVRVRAKMTGTIERPRLSVHATLTRLAVQFIDDAKGRTVLGLSSDPKAGTKTEQATVLGKTAAEQAIAKGIKTVIFDRGSHRYHGRVKALAEALRTGGLIF